MLTRPSQTDMINVCNISRPPPEQNYGSSSSDGPTLQASKNVFGKTAAFLFHGALRAQKPYGLLGTGERGKGEGGGGGAGGWG